MPTLRKGRQMVDLRVTGVKHLPPIYYSVSALSHADRRKHHQAHCSANGCRDDCKPYLRRGGLERRMLGHAEVWVKESRAMLRLFCASLCEVEQHTPAFLAIIAPITQTTLHPAI